MKQQLGTLTENQNQADKQILNLTEARKQADEKVVNLTEERKKDREEVVNLTEARKKDRQEVLNLTEERKQDHEQIRDLIKTREEDKKFTESLLERLVDFMGEQQDYIDDLEENISNLNARTGNALKPLEDIAGLSGPNTFTFQTDIMVCIKSPYEFYNNLADNNSSLSNVKSLFVTKAILFVIWG